MGLKIGGRFSLLAAGLILLIGGGTSVQFARLDIEKQLTAERTSVLIELATTRAQFEGNIKSAISSTQGLTDLIGLQKEIDKRLFESMARHAIEQTPAIRNVAIAENDVVNFVYPFDANKAVLGLNYSLIPEQYKSVIRARALARPVLIGPVDLVQGGNGFIVRVPIFKNTHQESGTPTEYWGVASVVLNMEALLRESGIIDNPRLKIALLNQKNAQANTNFVTGSSAFLSDAPVMMDVDVPGSIWQLAAVPIGGWRKHSFYQSTYFWLYAVQTILLTLLVYLVLQRIQQSHLRSSELEQEVAERKRTEVELERSRSKLEQVAHFDILTDLPNRVLFQDRLSRAIDHAARNQSMMALLLLDLDGFKAVNDSHGHPVGDYLLKQVAQRLLTCTRADDTVARLGGDEFVLILSDIDDINDVVVVAQKILHGLQEPFILAPAGNALATVTASLGIALYPNDATDMTDLMRDADTAMYQAKSDGRNAYRFYQRRMTEETIARLALEQALRDAMDWDQFVIHFQPQIELKTGNVTGAEALLRWRSPDRGFVSPNEFIPLAERTGLILPIGEYVLRKVCQLGAAWLKEGLHFGKLAVNVSSPQIERSDFTHVLKQILLETGLPTANLEIEITESLLMESGSNAVDTLNAVQALGVTVAIDDFGTGYSSLAYLKKLPINNLKIDRTFVQDIPDDQNDVAITHAIIGMAHNLGFAVIAEGIETEAQRDFLAQAGCDEAQGYLISRPMPAEDFAEWLRHRPANTVGFINT